MRDEYPQGRRVNALAPYEPFARTPALDAVPFERTLTSDDLLAYPRERRACRGRRCGATPASPPARR